MALPMHHKLKTLGVSSKTSVKASGKVTFVFTVLQTQPGVFRLFDRDGDISVSRALDY